MKNEEEKFDDLLQNKLSERDFFFDELNWQKESELIAQSENRRKRRRFILIFFSGLIAGVALTISLIPFLNTRENNKIAGAFNTQGSTTPNGNVSNVRQTNADTKSENTGSLTPLNRCANKANENPHPAGNTLKNENEQGAKGSVTNYVASIHNKKITPNKTNTTGSQNKPNNHLAAASSQSNNTSIAYTKAEQSKKHKQNKSTIHSSSPPLASEQPVKTNPNPDNAASEKAVTSESNTAITKQTTSGNGIANSDTNTNKPNVKPDTNALIAKNKTLAKKAPDSNTAKASNPDTVPIPIPKPSSTYTYFGFDIGGGYSFGWKGKSGTEANGLSPIVGVHLMHFFNKKVGLSIGIQYNSVTHLKTGYSNSVITYDFGYNNNITTVTPKTLHYVAVPLAFTYNPDDKNALCAGGSVLYLINTSSTVSTTAQNELNPPASHTKTSFGYTDGFNKMDVQASVAYRRKIYKGIFIKLEGYYGFMDIETNSFFSDNSLQRNSGFKLILSYDFGK